MNKIKNYIIYCLVLLSILEFCFGFIQIKEKNRYENNYYNAIDSIKVIKKENQILYQVSENSINKDEFKELLKKELSNIDIKPRLVNNYTEINSESKSKFTTFVKDSTINDTVKIKFWNYKDKFISIKCIEKDSIRIVDRKNIVDLKIIESKEPRKSLNKLILKPFIRKVNYSVITNDTNLLVTSIKRYIKNEK